MSPVVLAPILMLFGSVHVDLIIIMIKGSSTHEAQKGYASPIGHSINSEM